MDNVVYYTELYDYYKDLLTDTQKKYFEDYYFKNLSFSEISDKYNVSRNAVYNEVKFTKKNLEKYEASLHIKSKTEEIEALLDDSNTSKKIIEIIER